MKRLRKQIHYSFENTPNGGRVVISSTDKEAKAAVHAFLRCQIEEHTTGDTTEAREPEAYVGHLVASRLSARDSSGVGDPFGNV